MIKVLIGGIPSNINSGDQCFIDMLIPLDISYIEMVGGTNVPSYGLPNIGGNLDSRVTYGMLEQCIGQFSFGDE